MSFSWARATKRRQGCWGEQHGDTGRVFPQSGDRRVNSRGGGREQPVSHRGRGVYVSLTRPSSRHPHPHPQTLVGAPREGSSATRTWASPNSRSAAASPSSLPVGTEAAGGEEGGSLGGAQSSCTLTSCPPPSAQAPAAAGAQGPAAAAQSWGRRVRGDGGAADAEGGGGHPDPQAGGLGPVCTARSHVLPGVGVGRAEGGEGGGEQGRAGPWFQADPAPGHSRPRTQPL